MVLEKVRNWEIRSTLQLGRNLDTSRVWRVNVGMSPTTSDGRGYKELVWTSRVEKEMKWSEFD